MTAAVFVECPPEVAARVAADDERHRRLAGEAGAVGGVPAVDFYRGLTIPQLEKVTWDLSPSDDDEAIADGEPRTARRLRLWHAAWVALEGKYARRDRRRAAREARTMPAPAAVGVAQ
ncbi:MAG: hypothetical protein M3Q10_01495 [Chloroflexota bacterium]|nr:hypothetical protein [Chloroflexota bacterium]